MLLTLGFAFIIADVCLMLWTGDPWQPATPEHLRGAVQVAGLYFPFYRLVVVLVAVAIAVALWLLVDWTRLGAMIRAGVDDAPIARVVGIKVSQLFTLVFALGAALAAFGGVMGGAVSLGISGPRLRDAAACPHRGDPGRHGQPARGAGRQLHHRLSL